MTLQLSPAGIELIKKEEFFVDHSYKDSEGNWTIGYGSTKYLNGDDVESGEKISEPEAEKLLILDAARKADLVSDLIKVELNQNQQDSLISLIYNIGTGAFSRSTVLKLINKDINNPDIKYWWLKWNKIFKNGKFIVLPGLTHRREKEYALFTKK